MGDTTLPTEPMHTRDLPWWVRSILYIGVMPALLLYLVWNLTTTSAETAIRTTETLILMKENLSLHATSQSTHDHQSRSADEALLRVMLQICANTASSSDERAGCFRLQP